MQVRVLRLDRHRGVQRLDRLVVLVLLGQHRTQGRHRLGVLGAQLGRQAPLDLGLVPDAGVLVGEGRVERQVGVGGLEFARARVAVPRRLEVRIAGVPLLGLGAAEVGVAQREVVVAGVGVALDQIVEGLDRLVVLLLVHEAARAIHPHGLERRDERGVVRHLLQALLEDGLGLLELAHERVGRAQVAHRLRVAGPEQRGAAQAGDGLLVVLHGLVAERGLALVRRRLGDVGVGLLRHLDVVDALVECPRPVGVPVAGRPVRLLLVTLGRQALDGLREGAPGGAGAVDLGVRPAEIPHRFEVGRVLARAGLELGDRLAHLAAVALGVALVLVTHPLRHVQDAARAMRIARQRSPRHRHREQGHAQGTHRHASDLQWILPYRAWAAFGSRSLR